MKSLSGLGDAAVRTATSEENYASELLRCFWESDLASLEVKRESAGMEMPALVAEAGLDFERLRNRFRIMANLNPGWNKADEVGTIRFTYLSDETFRAAEVEGCFPGDAERFWLKRAGV